MNVVLYIFAIFMVALVALVFADSFDNEKIAKDRYLKRLAIMKEKDPKRFNLLNNQKDLLVDF